MKKVIKLVFLLFAVTCMFSCKKKVELPETAHIKPNMDIMTTDYNLDFDEIHNYVIADMAHYKEFFFVKNNQFDISGDNANKTIKVECTCLNGTLAQDADLLISLVLNGIAMNSSEQDFRFKAPSQDKDGTYLDFGTIFNTYALSVIVKDENNNIIKNINIKPGDSIPIDPRFWSE